MLNNFYL